MKILPLMKRAFFVILVPLLLMPQTSPTNTLEIGAVPIYLGMPQKDAVSRLRANNLIVNDSNPNSVTVLQSRPDTDINSLLGVVEFKNGRAFFINRSWTPDESDGPTVVRGLYGALATEMGSSSSSDCRIFTGTTTGPTSEIKDISILCRARHVIKLSLTRYQGQDFVDVSEIVQ